MPKCYLKNLLCFALQTSKSTFKLNVLWQNLTQPEELFLLLVCDVGVPVLRPSRAADRILYVKAFFVPVAGLLLLGFPLSALLQLTIGLQVRQPFFR